MKPARTHYECLGVPRDASPEEIKHAFRMQALKTHPDVVWGRSVNLRRANQEFTALHEAYVTLLDPRQRAEYDAHLGQPAANLFSPPEGGRRPTAFARRRLR